MNNIHLKELIQFLPENIKTLGIPNNIRFNNAKEISEANEYSIVWVDIRKKEKKDLINHTLAKIIIVDKSYQPEKKLIDEKYFILVDNPKLTYINILNCFFPEEKIYKIHKTAIIHKEAIISNEVYIGEYVVLGKCKIGKGTFIDSFCKIADNTIIGSNVKIKSGAKIGTDGFGYAEDENNNFVHFPHIGGVIIEDNVDIGANTCIDKGALGNTIIKKGAKIDNLVQIAHNVKVGNP